MDRTITLHPVKQPWQRKKYRYTYLNIYDKFSSCSALLSTYHDSDNRHSCRPDNYSQFNALPLKLINCILLSYYKLRSAKSMLIKNKITNYSI